MIAKQRIGNGFGGVCRYVLDKSVELGDEQGRVAETNMAGETARELAREFAVLRSLAPGCRKPVAHIAVRWAVEDQISPEAAVTQARALLTRLNYTDVPYLMALHRTQEPGQSPDIHLHIVASRIRFDGSVVSTHDNYRRGARACRELEREYGLVRADAPERARTTPIRLSKDELHLAERCGEAPAKLVLAQRLVLACGRSDGTWQSLCTELARMGVTTHPIVSRRTGEQTGMRYTLAENTTLRPMQGRAIGKAFDYPALNRRLELQRRQDDERQVSGHAGRRPVDVAGDGRSLQREVATLGALVAQLAEEQRRTVQSAEGSIRTRLESQLAAHIGTMQEVADQTSEQHHLLSRTLQDLAEWTRRHDTSVERLQAVYQSAGAKASALSSTLDGVGQRLATHEQTLGRMLGELVHQQNEAHGRRRGYRLGLLGLLLLAMLLGGAAVVVATTLGLPMISLR